MIITSTQHFLSRPQKIISLVPSQTELLYYFGLNKEVIGITKFCVHPQEWFKNKTRIGGTKNLNINLIKRLQPHLIIANKEENDKQQIEELADELNVWVTNVNNLEEAYQMIKDVGELTHKTNEALMLIAGIKKEFSQLLHNMSPLESSKTLGQTHKNQSHPTGPSVQVQTAYLIWQKPYMTIGGDTFINDMMKHCGLYNVFSNKNRYPEISLDDLGIGNMPDGRKGCQLILLSSEPYPFKQKHLDELQNQLPDKKIILVDGEMFSWYGSRLLQVPQYFKNLREQLMQQKLLKF